MLITPCIFRKNPLGPFYISCLVNVVCSERRPYTYLRSGKGSVGPLCLRALAPWREVGPAWSCQINRRRVSLWMRTPALSRVFCYQFEHCTQSASELRIVDAVKKPTVIVSGGLEFKPSMVFRRGRCLRSREAGKTHCS